MSDATSTTRRRFLQRSAGAGLAAALTTDPVARAAHGGVDDTLRLGLVGCGGRGRGAAIDALTADPRTRVVALGDAFEDQAQRARRALAARDDLGDRGRVDPERVFWGFDAFRHVIDAGVDAVLLATPPHFRPEHLACAVERGKHCFVEKPVAVDAVGCAAVAEACEAARDRGLSIVSGLCWRYDPGVVETIERIAGGAIGRIVAIESAYHTGTLWHRGDRPEWSRMEYQLRNWLYHTWLSGDFITEQAVHSLDKSAWLLGDASPIRAEGMGGRQQRTGDEYGDVYDHFAVRYEFPGGTPVFFSCRQQANCAGKVDELVHGSEGTARVLAREIRGERPWRYEGPAPSMYVREQAAFLSSIRDGAARNDGAYMVNSTRLALLGRAAAYTGAVVAWDALLRDETRLGPTDYAWGAAPTPRVAVPGVA